MWRIWDPEFQYVKAKSDVILDEGRNAHMSHLHECNEIDTNIVRRPENNEFIEQIHSVDEPFWSQDSQYMQFGKRSTAHMHQAPDEEADNVHSWCLSQDDQTAQCSAADAENITHSRPL